MFERHETDHLSEKFVEGLEDELDEASLGRRVRRLLRELPGLRVEVDVAPETPRNGKKPREYLHRGPQLRLLTFMCFTGSANGVATN